MFDCVGYVFGSGLVFRIDKKRKKEKRRQKKERKGKEKRGGRGRKMKKNRATFAVFNLLSGGQAQLTER